MLPRSCGLGFGRCADRIRKPARLPRQHLQRLISESAQQMP
jgi:hypothetical protein